MHPFRNHPIFKIYFFWLLDIVFILWVIAVDHTRIIQGLALMLFACDSYITYYGLHKSTLNSHPNLLAIYGICSFTSVVISVILLIATWNIA